MAAWCQQKSCTLPPPPFLAGADAQSTLIPPTLLQHTRHTHLHVHLPPTQHIRLPATPPPHFPPARPHIPPRPSTAAPEAAWRLLLHPGIYKHAVKWAHREEWARSIQESHPASAERDELLSRFWQEAGVVERALGPLLAAAGGAARWAQQGGEPSPHAWFS